MTERKGYVRKQRGESRTDVDFFGVRKACGGYALVCAFTSESGGKVVGGECFAGFGEARGAGDEIDIEGADDGHCFFRHVEGNVN